MAKNSLCQHSAAALAGIENGVFYHDPVMLKECLEGLNIKPNGTYGDCTLGGGGHSYAIANKLDENGTLHAFDRDEEAVAFATKRLAGVKPKFIVHPVRFGELKNEIPPNTLDGILYDLGISSHQVDDSARGFTFVGDNPLDLRMDRREGVSAQEWLKTVDADTLAAALRKNADMDRAFKLATRLIEMAASKGDQEILPSEGRGTGLRICCPGAARSRPSGCSGPLPAVRPGGSAGSAVSVLSTTERYTIRSKRPRSSPLAPGVEVT